MAEVQAYPFTKSDDGVVDERHGVTVPDPYRWLEDGESEETRAWVESQNARTFAHLETIPQRPEIRRRLVELWNEPRTGTPWRRGSWWFEMRHDGVQNQEVLWVAEAAEGGGPPAAAEFRSLLDVNPLSSDGTTSITQLSPTSGGDRIAYALSEAGSDWVTWRVRDVRTGTDLPDVIRWSKFGNLAWLPDGERFLYPWYEPPAPGTELEASVQSQRLRIHRLGTEQDEDPIFHEDRDHPKWSFDPTVSHDGRWLIISLWEGSLDANRILVAPIESGEIGPVRTLVADTGAHLQFVGALGRSLVFLTNHTAPRGRVVAIDPEEVESCAWKTLVAENENRIENARLVGAATPGAPGWILLHRWKDATSELSSVPVSWTDEAPNADGMTGTPSAIRLPERLSSILGLTSDRQDGRFHLQLETFLTPARVLSGDLSSGSGLEARDGSGDTPAPQRWASSRQDPSLELVTERVFIEHDGVRIPVFLLRRADVEPNGDVPTILYGYGGFDISITPAYSVAWRVWAERGGLVAVACLRGGGEYGKAWHDAGKTPHKQNVFGDAIAVATWLTERWTRTARLGITGRSNGGLLVGACMTQRPDLFGACVPEVGVMDMLRFHLFTIGWAWVGDYGSADDPAQFRELLAYSPLHNLREDTCYPSTLVTTGDHDDRVVPAHSYKFAARLQAVQSGGNPTLLRVDVAAGHGAGKPLAKRIDERADVLAFLEHHLDDSRRT